MKNLLLSLSVVIMMCGLFSACDSGPGSSSRSAVGGAAGSGSGQTKITGMGNDSVAKGSSATGAGAAITSSADSQTTEPTALIYGTVLSHSGDRATSVVVSLSGYRKLPGTQAYEFVTLGSARTDAEGKYEIRGAVAQSFILKISGDVPDLTVTLSGHSFYENENPRSGITRLKQDIQLPESTTLAGQVTDASGAALAGLPVQMYPKIPQYQEEKNRDNRDEKITRTTTTAEGRFEFANVASGPWQIATVHPDYAPLVQDIQLPTSTPLMLKLTAVGGTVTGRAVHKLTGAPAADIPIHLEKADNAALADMGLYNTTSTADGAFRFDHVSAGETHIAVPVTASSVIGMASPAPGKIDLKDGETTDVTVLVYPGHTMTGRVYDKDTDDGLPGASVWGQNGNTGVQTLTGDKGDFKLEHLFSGGVDVRSVGVRLDGYALKQDSNSMQNRGDTTVGITYPPDTLEVKQDFAMVRKVNIRGTVVTNTDKPVPHARVYLSNSNDNSSGGGSEVKPDGTFEVEAMPFTKVTVSASASGYAVVSSDKIELTTVDVDNIKLVLDPGATVSGRVLDPEGKPLAGAFISAGYIDPRSQPSRTSNENGVYTMSDLPKKVMMSADKGGFASALPVELTLTSGEVRADVDLTMRKSFSISGRVIRENGEPAPEASLWASSGKNGLGYSEADVEDDGRFEIKGLPEGTYTINIYQANADPVIGVKAGTTDLVITVKSSGRKATPSKNKLIGTVIDDISGEPIEDFTAKADGKSMTKLEQPGKFEIANMVDGAIYTIKLSSPGYLAKEEPSITGEGGKTMEQTFRMSKGGVVTGRLVDKTSKKPLPGIVVVNWGDVQIFDRNGKTPENHTVTDAEGRFVLAPAPMGENYVLAKPGAPYSELGKTAKVASEETADLGDMELSSGGTINGTVVRGSKDEPVRSVKVYLNGSSIDLTLDRSTNTDADGKFKFEGLPPLTYAIQAGGVNKSTVIDGEKSVDVILRMGGTTMSGKVTRGGTPAEVSITAVGPEGAKFSSWSRAGEYSLDNMMPGEYQVTLSAQNGHDIKEPETVKVPDDPEFKHDFVLPNGSIEVTVVDGADKPVDDASIALTRKSTGAGVDQLWTTRVEGQQRTDAGGHAKFDGLAAGTYGVTARKIDVGTAMQPNIKVTDAGSTPVNLKLSTEGGTLVSVALNYATGQPMAEPWCYLHSETGPFTHKARRGADGVMTITGVPPGVYTTNVSYWAFSQSQQQVEIKANETARIEDVLYPAGAIHWTLKTGSGAPATGAQVTVTAVSSDPAEEPHNGVTPADGKFVQRGLAPGTYQVTATYQGKAGPTETFTLIAGQNAMKETVAPGW